MNYKGIEFEAIIATPGCGKSYLSDNYPNLFADMDEIRLKLKYDIPLNITREELEKTKGNRNFKKKEYTIDELYDLYDNEYNQGKILIAAPHKESFKYFEKRNIKFCFVYPSLEAKEDIIKRFQARNNSEKFIKENMDLFDQFYIENKKDTRACIHYEFTSNEYLSDILKKFNLKF